MTRYRTIVADPPWAYPEGHVRTARTGHSHNRIRDGAIAVQGADVRRALPYPSMTLSEIRGIPVGTFAAPGECRLFLWSTSRYMPDAYSILVSWGFTYRQTLVWHKADGAPFPGSVAGNTVEFLLVGTLGKPERVGTVPSALIKVGYSKRGGHSAKPEAFLDLVEQVSPGPYLEMFSRRARMGWDTWGDESLHGGEAA